MNLAILVVGGGAAGFVTAAYLDAISCLGINYSSIYGSSSGALNAAVYHSHSNVTLKEIWTSIKNEDVYKDNLLTWLGMLDSHASCFDSSPLRKIIEKYVDENAVTKKPSLYVSVTDIAAERSLTINLTTTRSNICDWIYASASPPVLFSSVAIFTKHYCDGGLGELVNLTMAIRNGAEKIIVLCPKGKAKNTTIKNGLDAAKFIVDMPLNYQIEKELNTAQLINPNVEIVLVRPLLDDQPGILDFTSWGSYANRLAKWEYYKFQALTQLASYAA